MNTAMHFWLILATEESIQEDLTLTRGDKTVLQTTQCHVVVVRGNKTLNYNEALSYLWCGSFPSVVCRLLIFCPSG